MAEEIVISIILADPELLDSTIAEYVANVERGTMTEEQAEEDISALALGMMKVDFGG